VIERRDGDPVAIAARDSRVKQHHRIDPARHGKNETVIRAERVAHRGLNEANIVVAHLCNISCYQRLRAGSSLFARLYFPAVDTTLRSNRLETHGPLGTLWVGIALGCFYIALIWLNTLLGFFLTPLFIIPTTWLMDRISAKRNAKQS
jgi:hypothetical protein